jgi:hypothetical protein
MRVFKDWKQFAIYDNEKQGTAREQFLMMLLHQEERMLT